MSEAAIGSGVLLSLCFKRYPLTLSPVSPQPEPYDRFTCSTVRASRELFRRLVSGLRPYNSVGSPTQK